MFCEPCKISRTNYAIQQAKDHAKDVPYEDIDKWISLAEEMSSVTMDECSQYFSILAKELVRIKGERD